MQFSTLALTSLLAALSLAAPSKRSSETLTVKSLSIRDNNGIQATSLTLQPVNVTCSSSSAADLADYKVVGCGEGPYSFAVNGTDSTYTLRLYKGLGAGYGLYGESKKLPVYCHAGGNGADDFACAQVGGIKVTIGTPSK